MDIIKSVLLELTERGYQASIVSTNLTSSSGIDQHTFAIDTQIHQYHIYIYEDNTQLPSLKITDRFGQEFATFDLTDPGSIDKLLKNLALQACVIDVECRLDSDPNDEHKQLICSMLLHECHRKFGEA